MTYEVFRAQVLDFERRQDTDARAGILGCERFPYRYIGPPLIHTSDAEIERMWLSHVQVMYQARTSQWIWAADARMDPRPKVEDESLYDLVRSLGMLP